MIMKYDTISNDNRQAFEVNVKDETKNNFFNLSFNLVVNALFTSYETGNSRHLPSISSINTVQKMKFSVNDVFSKCDQIRSFLRISSHLLKKSLMINFIFVKHKIYILYERHIFSNNADHIQCISHVIDIYQTFKYH